jgi:hypothetical protein
MVIRMMLTYPEYRRHDPLRPVDWRRRRAEYLSSPGRRCSVRRDDELTREAVHFLRQRERCRTYRQLRQLARRYPAIAEAWRLDEQGGAERTAVEARLLARQSPGSIAAACRLPLETVAAFEALFFNIVDRLDATDWIFAAALGSLHVPTPPEEQVSAFARHLAYFGGEAVADLVLPRLPRLCVAGGQPAMGRDGTAVEDRLTTQMRALLLAMTDPEAAFKAAATVDFRADTSRAQSPTVGAICGSLLAKSFDAVLDKLAVEAAATPNEAEALSPSRQDGEAA